MTLQVVIGIMKEWPFITKLRIHLKLTQKNLELEAAYAWDMVNIKITLKWHSNWFYYWHVCQLFCVKCHSFLLLLDVYSETVQEYCDKNGNNRSFSELDTAKASCLTDGNCIGLYDECGRGSSFFHCSAPMAVRPSSCGSILYQQIGTQIISL